MSMPPRHLGLCFAAQAFPLFSAIYKLNTLLQGCLLVGTL